MPSRSARKANARLLQRVRRAEGSAPPQVSVPPNRWQYWSHEDHWAIGVLAHGTSIVRFPKSGRCCTSWVAPHFIAVSTFQTRLEKHREATESRLASAIGAKLPSPDRQVWVGGMTMASPGGPTRFSSLIERRGSIARQHPQCRDKDLPAFQSHARPTMSFHDFFKMTG